MIKNECFLVKMRNGKPVEYRAGIQSELVMGLLHSGDVEAAERLANESQQAKDGWTRPTGFVYLIREPYVRATKKCRCPDIDNGWFVHWPHDEGESNA